MRLRKIKNIGINWFKSEVKIPQFIIILEGTGSVLNLFLFLFHVYYYFQNSITNESKKAMIVIENKVYSLQ